MDRNRDRFKQISQLKEDESRRYRQRLDREAARAQAEKRLHDDDERFTRDLLRDAGVDVARIEEHERVQADERRAFVQEVRAGLMASGEGPTDHHVRRTLAFELSNGPGTQTLLPYTASLRASNDLILDGIGGTEEDDGSITPDGPDLLTLAVSDSGGGTFGTVLGGNVVPVAHADVYYTFVPEATGTHQVVASMDLHGFYYVTSNDKWWNSKEARVSMEVEVGAKQYGSFQSWKSWTVVKERKTNGTIDGRLDVTQDFPSKVELAKDDPVAVLVRISLEALADGGGTFAEINFAEGSANYIGMLPMTAQHL